MKEVEGYEAVLKNIKQMFKSNPQPRWETGRANQV